LLIFGTVWQGSNFISLENMKNILNQNAGVGLIALGMTFVIIGGGIDLSVGSMMGLAGVVTMATLNKVGAQPTAILIGGIAAVFFGAIAGALNGFLITTGRIAPFVATLAGFVGFRSIALATTNASEQRTPVGLNAFEMIAKGGIPLPGMVNSRGVPLKIEWPIIVFFATAGVSAWFLNKTNFGRRLIATGANEQASIYSGINTNRIKMITYIFLGVCVGIAGLMQASRLNSVSPSSLGLGLELDAIAAVVIGGTSLNGGKGQIGTTVVGVFLLAIISNLLILAGVDPNWQGCLKGVIILLAVLLQRSSRQNA
jgi:ribose transport system permease protein